MKFKDADLYPEGTEPEHVIHDAMVSVSGKKIINMIVVYAFEDKDDDGKDDVFTSYYRYGSAYGNLGLMSHMKNVISKEMTE